MNILFSKNKNLFAIIFLMTVSLATINLLISTFKVKNAFAITAEEMLTDQYLKKELVKFLLIFDVLYVKTNLLMTQRWNLPQI